MGRFYKIKKYRKEFDYSYALGPYPSIEIIRNHPEKIDRVILSKDFNEKEDLISKLEANSIRYVFEEQTLLRIGERKNIYVAVAFKKWRDSIIEGNHIILDQIDNMGNLGTIIRTMCAFNFYDLALIGKTVDHFNPKVIRSSMGAISKVRIEQFNSIDEYKEKFNNNIYAFMLMTNSKGLKETEYKYPYTLAFGNEGQGLGMEYNEFYPVFIEQNTQVDSLNLPMACGIGMYHVL